MEELATSLAETLALHFPQGPPAHDEKLVRRWLEELMEATASDTDMADEVMRCAVEKWNSIEPEQPKKAAVASSFSLLDQLSAMPKRVFFHDINGASSPQERLQLLQQVDHVDDVTTDWKSVLEMLFGGLTKGNNISEYILIHAKWFDQCDSSMESTFIQFGLCANLVKALRYLFGTQSFVSEAEILELTDQQQVLFEMMQQWHVMWMTSMKNFATDDCMQMARDMMQLMRNLSPGAPAKFVWLPAHFMALIDPYAEWFALWIGHAVSPADAVNNLLSTGLFFDLIQRCNDQGYIRWEELSNESLGERIIIPPGKDVQVRQLERALLVQTLCMVRSILVSSRVALFPWKEMSASDHSSTQVPCTCLLESSPRGDETYTPALCDEHPANEILTVLDYFMRPIRNPSSPAHLTAICCEAVETILWGVRNGKCMREVLQFIVDADENMQGTIEARRDLFSVVVRVYRGTDWTKEKDTQAKVVDFLKLLRQQCMLGPESSEYVEFEALLQDFVR